MLFKLEPFVSYISFSLVLINKYIYYLKSNRNYIISWLDHTYTPYQFY